MSRKPRPKSPDRRKDRAVGWQEARLAADLPIGSGLIEAGHRHVLHARLKVSGAWWQRDNAEAIIQARVCRANSQWAASWQTSRTRKQPPAAKPPKPVPHF